MSTLSKYAAESRTYTFDFSQRDEIIISGDTISSINSVTVSPSGLTIGSTSISGKGVNAVISGGTSGSTYNLTCLITTSSGAILECQGTLLVT